MQSRYHRGALWNFRRGGLWMDRWMQLALAVTIEVTVAYQQQGWCTNQPNLGYTHLASIPVEEPAQKQVVAEVPPGCVHGGNPHRVGSHARACRTRTKTSCTSRPSLDASANQQLKNYNQQNVGLKLEIN